jgi:23S rRNA pseudouridine1911/1915/1917 synthase
MVKRTVAFTITAVEAGQRLDKVLVGHLPQLGRRQARKLFEAGAVRVNGRRAAGGRPARAGEAVVVTLAEPGHAFPEPDAPLCVHLETAQLLVIDKPAGQPTAALSADDRGSLAGALVGHYPELALVGPDRRESGLLHRLDNQTSGLLVAARCQCAFASLQRGQREGRLQKRYLAVVTGTPPGNRGVIAMPLGQHPTDPRRVQTCDSSQAARSGREASTQWRLLSRAGPHSLLQLDLTRAFRHQVRVHLASIGCPIVGDQTYGGAHCQAIGQRHALHASALRWTGNQDVPAFAVRSRLPAELAALLSE